MAVVSRGIKEVLLAIFLCSFCTLLTRTSALPNAKVEPFIDVQTPLWKRGEAEVVIYRIPNLTYTPKGRLLAAAEARKYSGSDTGPKFIAIRRSKDALGKTGGSDMTCIGDYKAVYEGAVTLCQHMSWEPMQDIVDDGYLIFDGLNLGNILVDDEAGIIFIMYSVCYHHNKCDASITKLVKSFDDGITWSKPIDLTDQVGNRQLAPGPGFGIQKKLAPNKGRLISCGHGAGMLCLLSDDHGLTWRWGGTLQDDGSFHPDECQLVELSDGSLMANIRNSHQYECDCRIVARSYDGGESFPMKDVYVDETLIEPACAAGMVFHNDVLYFSNPNSKSSRVNLTLRWSYDNGTSWAGALQIWDKASGYSTMTAHPGPSPYVFILYEKGNVTYTESIAFVRINLNGGV